MQAMFGLNASEIRWAATILILTAVVGGLAGYNLFYEPFAVGIKVWPLMVMLILVLILVLVMLVKS